jgi:hypothetical protein
LEADAWAIRKRATRRLGELMAAQKETVGLAKGGGDQKSDHRVIKKPSDHPTLAEAGIDKNLAHQARLLAAIGDVEFDCLLKEGRDSIVKEIDKTTLRIVNAGARASVANRLSHIEDGQYDCIVIDPLWPMEKLEQWVWVIQKPALPL